MEIPSTISVRTVKMVWCVFIHIVSRYVLLKWAIYDDIFVSRLTAGSPYCYLRGTKWRRRWSDIVVFGYFNHFKGRVILFFSSISFFMCSICIMQVSTLDYHNYLTKYYKKFVAPIAYIGFVPSSRAILDYKVFILKFIIL